MKLDFCLEFLYTKHIPDTHTFTLDASALSTGHSKTFLANYFQLKRKNIYKQPKFNLETSSSQLENRKRSTMKHSK